MWVVLSLISATMLAQSLSVLGIPVLYPFIRDEFGLSRAQVGLITSSQAIGFALTAVLAGWLVDSFGAKRMIAIAMLSLAVFTLAFPLAYAFPVVLVLMVLIGIFSSPVYPGTARAVMDWFPGKMRALAMGFIQTGFPVGGALTAAVLPALAAMIGWRMAAAFMGMLVLAIAIMFMTQYHDVPREGRPARQPGLDTLKIVIQNRTLVLTIIWGAAFFGLQYIVLTYFMLFLIEEQGLSAVTAGGLLAIAQVSSIISRVLWGAASDFIFRGRRIAILSIIGMLTFIWMLGISMAGEGTPAIVIYLISILAGISTLSFHGILVTLIGEQAQAGRVGVTVGMGSMMNHIGQIALPPIFGYLADMSGSYFPGWRIAAAVALASTLALLAFGREPQRH